MPIPVERCPLDQLLSDHQQQQLALSKQSKFNPHRDNAEKGTRNCHKLTLIVANFFSFPQNADEAGIYSGNFNVSEIDLPEKLCSEHIAELVNLKYHLATTETSGCATLRGISLSSTMLDLVTVSPIQWGKKTKKF